MVSTLSLSRKPQNSLSGHGRAQLRDPLHSRMFMVELFSFFSFRTRLWRCVRGVGNNLGRETLHLRTFCSFYRSRFAPVLQVRKLLKYWGHLRGFTSVSSLNFKTSRFAFRGGSHVAISILLFYLLFSLSLSQFQPIFVSFVTTFAALYFWSNIWNLLYIRFSISNSLVSDKQVKNGQVLMKP